MPVATKDSFPLKINEYDTIKARVLQDCKLLRVDILTDEYGWRLENKKDFFILIKSYVGEYIEIY